MQRSVLIRRSLAAFAGLLVAVGGLWLLGWWPWASDPSVVVARSQQQYDPKVENGSAFDRAAVELGTATAVVVPHNADVRRTADPGTVYLFMRKTLAFAGHPPERMSIRDARENMGCAVRAEGSDLAVATFGEWDSRIEGGAFMSLVVVVPGGIEVVPRVGLSGPDSDGREWHGQWLTKPKDAKGGWWYGPASPAEGWTAVPDVPDPGSAGRRGWVDGTALLRRAWLATWAALGVSVVVVSAGVLAAKSRTRRVIAAVLGSVVGGLAFVTGVVLSGQMLESLPEEEWPVGPGVVRSAIGLGLVALLADLGGLLVVLRDRLCSKGMRGDLAQSDANLGQPPLSGQPTGHSAPHQS